MLQSVESSDTMLMKSGASQDGIWHGEELAHGIPISFWMEKNVIVAPQEVIKPVASTLILRKEILSVPFPLENYCSSHVVTD